MMQLPDERRYGPNLLQFTSIQNTNEINGRSSLCLRDVCQACISVPENWHIYVKYFLTYLKKPSPCCGGLQIHFFLDEVPMHFHWPMTGDFE